MQLLALHRKGCLLWFVPHEQMKVLAQPDALPTYLFNRHAIRHHFCPHAAARHSRSARTRASRPRHQ